MNIDKDENDIIYRLPEEKDETPELGKSAGEDPPQSQRGNNRKRPRPLALMIRVLFNPVEGWKTLNRHKEYTPEVIARKCFFPMAGLAAASVLFDMIYGYGVAVRDVVVDAAVVFISFLIGFYASLFAGRVILGSEIGDRLDGRYGRTMLMIAMSTLALFFTLMHALPMLEPVLVFLPLWTIYTVTRGVRHLRAPSERATMVTTVVAALVVGMPVLTGWLFNRILS